MNDIKGIIEDVEKSDLVSDKVIKKVIEIIGQEEWQDIHDEESDICTTTGELIITLKGLSNLEKENADLKAKNKWYSEQVCFKECAEVWGNLDKAKGLLAKWIELFKPKLEDFPKPPIQVDTEKFLEEVK